MSCTAPSWDGTTWEQSTWGSWSAHRGIEEFLLEFLPLIRPPLSNGLKRRQGIPTQFSFPGWSVLQQVIGETEAAAWLAKSSMVGSQVTSCPNSVTGHLGLSPVCVGISLFVHKGITGTRITGKLFPPSPTCLSTLKNPHIKTNLWDT